MTCQTFTSQNSQWQLSWDDDPPSLWSHHPTETRSHMTSRLPPSKEVDVLALDIQFFLAKCHCMGVAKVPQKADCWRASNNFWPINFQAQNIKHDEFICIWCKAHFQWGWVLQMSHQKTMTMMMKKRKNSTEAKNNDDDEEELDEDVKPVFNTCWCTKISSFFDHLLRAS